MDHHGLKLGFQTLPRYRQETLILERSAEVHGYSFQAVGLGQPFTGVGALAGTVDMTLMDSLLIIL